MTRSVHLIVWGLDADQLQIPKFLSRFLASAEKTAPVSRDPITAMTRLAGMGDAAHFPIARASWQRDFPDQQIPRGLVRADPVHLLADLRELHLYPPDSLVLRPDENRMLINTLNEHLQVDGFCLHCADAGTRWYLSASNAIDLMASPPLFTGPFPLSKLEQAGSELRTLTALGTELQMLLHTSPVNEIRLKNGLAPVNALWFWGAGTKEGAANQTAISLESDSADVLAAAAASGISVRNLEDSFRRGESGNHLIVIDALRVQLCVSDWKEFGKNRDAIIARWLKPALRALALRRIDEFWMHGSLGSYRTNWLSSLKLLGF